MLYNPPDLFLYMMGLTLLSIINTENLANLAEYVGFLPDTSSYLSKQADCLTLLALIHMQVVQFSLPALITSFTFPLNLFKQLPTYLITMVMYYNLHSALHNVVHTVLQ